MYWLILKIGALPEKFKRGLPIVKTGRINCSHIKPDLIDDLQILMFLRFILLEFLGVIIITLRFFPFS